MNKIWLTEAWRIYKRSRYVKRHGLKQYKGNANQICQQIIEDCWNGKYYQVSTGHFCEFYMRDFGWCVDSLLKLGKKKRVLATLSYALQKYSEQVLTTTITPEGKCVDIFRYSPDTLAYLLRSLHVAKATVLVKKHKIFLEREAQNCFTICFDKKLGLAKKDVHLGSMKDEAERKSSTYDNCMLAIISQELTALKLKNPFKTYNIRQAIKDNLWNGMYFYDDLTKHHAVTGDSNLIPFWIGVFTDKKMIKSAFESIHHAQLDTPFPLQYSSKKYKEHKLHFVSFFVNEYEHTAIWMHMGPLYLQVLKNIDKKRYTEYKKKYAYLIERHKTVLEVFDANGTPYKTCFYHADEGMLWAANYLTL